MSLVYRFSKDVTDGRGDMKALLGGKGAGLAEMCRIGVPVPPGFTITTEAYRAYMDAGQSVTEMLNEQVQHALRWLSQSLDKQFGGTGMPLLLSVRSGAPVSMPGMMDTILNLGLNDVTVQALAEAVQNERFAYDSYRRFIQMYAQVVLGVDHDEFERLLEATRRDEKVQVDSEISANGLKQLVDDYKDVVVEYTGQPFPTDPMEQLWGAIQAVFKSWENPRAKFYRKIHHLDGSMGTAVNVQSMVFGNLGVTSGTGVCFSRNPSNGDSLLYGEYLVNAQGEDVVAGIRTPHPIVGADPKSMENVMPKAFVQLLDTVRALEGHFRDMQDIEFTVENGVLYLLQTRTGKRTSQASLRIAVDLCREGLIQTQEAVNRVDPNSLSQLLASEFDYRAKQAVLDEGGLLGKGLNAGPGAATGVVVLTAERAVELCDQGKAVVLVREETSPEDIAGMHSSVGILTQRGGMTSHAAVVARGMGKPCIVGCSEMVVDHQSKTVRFDETVLHEGEPISIDGSTGEVIKGNIPTQPSSLVRGLVEGDEEPDSLTSYYKQLMTWADPMRRLGVRANADSPEDAQLARALGAEGIGLCRTEHMFFGEQRIFWVRRMILAGNAKDRREALEHLLPFQVEDFYELFVAMSGLPVTIRLLDPPLHEFLPHTDALIEGLAREMNREVSYVKQRVEDLHESNPMLGHRGCRLGISHPEIYQMQVRAVVEAVKRARLEGVDAKPEIMVPLIGTKKELDVVRESISGIIGESGFEIPVGTMIETPRAALTAAAIAESADFFSFGTNDLTQCCLGLSRDDSGSFLPLYIEMGIHARDPFKTLDAEGVGQLVRMAAESGKATKSNIKMGVCGEHGGDPDSIKFIASTPVDYVSCSPYRVPVARLATAQGTR
ncbi:MAG: pyruvate, phosphate dikinase [Acidobacteria bacterium]|nr:pyruvate, phosphate dikinase [Acidobacteriota bacterium]